MKTAEVEAPPRLSVAQALEHALKQRSTVTFREAESPGATQPEAEPEKREATAKSSPPREVPVRAHHAPRFDIDTQAEELLEYLDEHGYAVVAGVADEEAVDRGKDLAWEFLEGVPNTSVRRNDPDTWGNKHDWLPSERNGIVSGFGFGQSPFMWHLRSLPRVKRAFAAVWGTGDLLVSFDGGNFFRPWRKNRCWLTDGGWWHVDQNALRPGRRGRVCVQGLVTLTDADDTTGGLVVLPGSHKQHDSLCERSPLARVAGDFVPVGVGDPALDVDAGLLVCAKAGDLVLWDSRTIHCNAPADLEHVASFGSDCSPPPGGWDLIRYVGYVCMTPARGATGDQIHARRRAYEQHCSTSHWPYPVVISGMGLPEQPGNDPASLTPEQRALVGYDRPARSGGPCAIM